MSEKIIDCSKWSIKRLKPELEVTREAMEIVLKDRNSHEQGSKEWHALNKAYANLATDEFDLQSLISRKKSIRVIRIIALVLVSLIAYFILR